MRYFINDMLSALTDPSINSSYDEKNVETQMLMYHMDRSDSLKDVQGICSKEKYVLDMQITIRLLEGAKLKITKRVVARYTGLPLSIVKSYWKEAKESHEMHIIYSGMAKKHFERCGKATQDALVSKDVLVEAN